MLTLDQSVFEEYERLFNRRQITKDDSEIQEWSKHFSDMQWNQIIQWHLSRCDDYFN